MGSGEALRPGGGVRRGEGQRVGEREIERARGRKSVKAAGDAATRRADRRQLVQHGDRTRGTGRHCDMAGDKRHSSSLYVTDNGGWITAFIRPKLLNLFTGVFPRRQHLKSQNPPHCRRQHYRPSHPHTRSMRDVADCSRSSACNSIKYLVRSLPISSLIRNGICQLAGSLRQAFQNACLT